MRDFVVYFATWRRRLGRCGDWPPSLAGQEHTFGSATGYGSPAVVVCDFKQVAAKDACSSPTLASEARGLGRIMTHAMRRSKRLISAFGMIWLWVLVLRSKERGAMAFVVVELRRFYYCTIYCTYCINFLTDMLAFPMLICRL